MTGETRTALMVWGGWSGHEPERTTARMAALLRQAGVDVVVKDTLDAYVDLAADGGVDVIVHTWTQGEITRPQLDGLSAAVERGAGLAGWHGGIIDSFRANTAYQFMTGGQWVAHPDNVIDYSVQMVPERRDHPIVVGLRDFRMRSEQYYLHVDPGNDVLATTTFGRREQAPWVEGVTMPVAWTRRWGRGRVFVNALGHVDADFDVPEAREMTVRGILWAAGGLPD
ncbi:MAG: ThuA domain-containing protein [Candidatus Dormiibacterota bacterium]